MGNHLRKSLWILCFPGWQIIVVHTEWVFELKGYQGSPMHRIPLQRWFAILITLLVIAGIVIFLIESGTLAELNFTAIQWQYLLPLLPLQILYYALLGLVLAIFVEHSGV